MAETVPEPLLSAIILGKYNRAQELRIIFQLDPESRMIDIPKKINREKIVTILGNLLENALEAAQ
ncbi:MAG TPA: histidine kinase, partial [Deltaproteobacteria bacterium]|nr:histidine kinase [Deltaproteobacteria bacterium]